VAPEARAWRAVATIRFHVKRVPGWFRIVDAVGVDVV
jgi:hypothetical protein